MSISAESRRERDREMTRTGLTSDWSSNGSASQTEKSEKELEPHFCNRLDRTSSYPEN